MSYPKSQRQAASCAVSRRLNREFGLEPGAFASKPVRYEAECCKIMLQMPPDVLSALYLGTDPADQQGGVNFVIRTSCRRRHKTHTPMAGILRDDSEHSCFGLGTSRHVPEAKPTSPFFTVQNKAGSVDAIASPGLSVVPLAVGELLTRPVVTPSKVVPVINVKRYRHKITPQLGFLFQLTQPRLGRWATAATFRRKKLQQCGLTLVTLKHNGVGVGRDTGKHAQDKGEL